MDAHRNSASSGSQPNNISESTTPRHGVRAILPFREKRVLTSRRVCEERGREVVSSDHAVCGAPRLIVRAVKAIDLKANLLVRESRHNRCNKRKGVEIWPLLLGPSRINCAVLDVARHARGTFHFIQAERIAQDPDVVLP